jgi:hypothetical protein
LALCESSVPINADEEPPQVGVPNPCPKRRAQARE